MDDINKGLPHYRSNFNLVHLRGISNGIADYKAFLADAFRTLCGGGLLLSVEWDERVHDKDGKAIASAEDGAPVGYRPVAWLTGPNYTSCVGDLMAGQASQQRCLYLGGKP